MLVLGTTEQAFFKRNPQLYLTLLLNRNNIKKVKRQSEF